jgi:diadenosine tetraphosphate (Ap4A) HIT family hydrolase
MSSPFLNVEKIVENEFAYAFYDGFPVSKGHTLIVPKRVVPEIFDLNDDEYRACFDLVKEVKDYLKEKYSPDGFNIGVNNGEDAGQTVFHAHIHVIPRYEGDVKNPRGGIRNIIPEKGDY